MKTQIERANVFRKLHIKGDPLILFNIWDAGSAQSMQEIGVKAIATSSWSVAAAHGYDDGEQLPFDLVLANIKRIVEKVDVPVTVDIEGGYAQTPTLVQDNVAKVIDTGVVGINFEDQVVGKDCLYSIKNQSERIEAIRETADHKSIPIFINARTDIFFQAAPNEHSHHHLEEAIERAVAYAESGANGFFAPGLNNPSYIAKLCEVSPIPINIMVMPDTPSINELIDMGVERISYGPGPYCQVMDALKEVGNNIGDIYNA